MDKFPAVIREEIELLLDLERCRLEREELVKTLSKAWKRRVHSDEAIPESEQTAVNREFETYLKEIEKRDSFIMHTIGVVNETRQRRKATVNL